MKSVLISIQPKWVEKIANGEKTIEVRKTRPKIETPFKCFIYETKDTTETPWVDEDGHLIFKGRGQVIGEFVCDNMTKYPYELIADGSHLMPYGDLEKTCLDGWELYDYLRVNDGYGWHISDLKIYNKPKELNEFKTVCKDAYYNGEDWFCNDGYDSCKVKDEERPDQEECAYFDCPSCGGESNEYADYAYCMCNGKKPITRPPQSWCYVEVE